MPRGTAQAYLTTDTAILPTPGPLPSIEPGREPAWGIPHLFPSGWVRMNQGTGPWVVRVPGGGRGLAPGQRPGTGGVS